MGDLNCYARPFTKTSEDEAIKKHGESVLESMKPKVEKKINWLPLIWVLIILAILCGLVGTVKAETASYYTYNSCIREGTSGICANGERMNDNDFTCASWQFSFGTMLRVTNLSNNRSVVVRVNDRGPSKRLYRKGRKIDLSFKAMDTLGGIKSGIIPVKIERISL